MVIDVTLVCLQLYCANLFAHPSRADTSEQPLSLLPVEFLKTSTQNYFEYVWMYLIISFFSHGLTNRKCHGFFLKMPQLMVTK